MNAPGISVFYRLVLILVTGLAGLLATPAFAQTDTVYQKPSLNNGMPPATPAPPPVIVKPPAPVVKTEETEETEKERRQREKEEKADSKERVPLQDKLFTGGTGGLQFGNYQTYVQIAPILGYKLTEWLGAGVGMSYTYYRYTDNYNRDYAFNIVGGKFFTQAMVYNNFFAHIEFEFIPYNKQTYSSLVLGPGYRQMITDKIGFDLMYLFNASPNANRIYDNSFLKAGLYIDL